MNTVQVSRNMIDIAHPDKEVEVSISSDEGNGHTMWINVDGMCRLRISRIDPKILKIEDRR